MFVIAGLGNPGTTYQGNRHNIGFMAVDAIHRRHGFAPWRRRFQADISEGTIAGTRVLLMKPQTYMNESGRAVGEALRFYKLDPHALLAIHDELDLPAGKSRAKRGGGHGGHNGLRSLDAHCGKEYLRLRLGIGHPGDKALVHNHVLGDFAKADSDWLDPLLEDISREIALLIEGKESLFMTRLSTEQGGAKKGLSLKDDARPKDDKGPKGVSHIRQARVQPARMPEKGPLADMLKKMFGKDDEGEA